MTLNDIFKEKIKNEYEDFMEEVGNYELEEIIDNVKNIALFKTIYDFLHDNQSLTDEQIIRLLNQDNIVKMIAERYSPTLEELNENFDSIYDDIITNMVHCPDNVKELFQIMGNMIDISNNIGKMAENEKNIFKEFVERTDEISSHLADSLLQFENPIDIVISAKQPNTLFVVDILSETEKYIDFRDIYTLPHKLNHKKVLAESKWRHNAINEITAIVPQPDFRTTISWIDFFRTIETECGDIKENNPYTSFISTLKEISEQHGETIVQQLYDIENGTMMLEEQLKEAAKFLADGGDISRIPDMAREDMFLKPYEELKAELECTASGGMDMC